MFTDLKKNRLECQLDNDISYVRYGSIVFFLILILTGIKIMCNSYAYEMSHAYTADAPLYWTVGRGILNGIKPYSGLYENKPVGIFLISALSMFLTDDTILCDVVCLVCLYAIAFLPAVLMYEYCWKVCKYNKTETLLYIGLALIQGFLLMLYCEERSGGFQVESMGAAFTCFYFWGVMHIPSSEMQGRKKTFFWIMISGFFVMCGVMMKEPFVLLMFSGSLMLAECKGDILRKTVLPLLTGGIMSVFLLLVCGILPEYIQIYLKHMLMDHINIYGSPFQRAFNIKKILNDIQAFSEAVLMSIIFSFIVYILYVCVSKNIYCKLRIWKLLTIGFSVFLASFSVGLGGQYYNHHFIFAAPLYMLAIVLEGRILADVCKNSNKLILLSINFLFLFSLGIKTNLPFAGDYTERYNKIVEKAEYVDSLLEYYGKDTYQFLGFNGEDSFCGLTKYSPKGPLFAQDPNNFQDEDSWACVSLLNQLENVDIVIIDYLNMPSINDKVADILNSEFINITSAELSDLIKPESFDYQIYYRIIE